MERYEHGGRIYDSEGKMGDWLDFSANINPFGLSDKILQVLTENLRGVVNYPDPNALELKRAISQRYGVDDKNLVVLNGAAEFFYLYLNVLRPKRVIIPVPSFSEYERAARAAFCEIKYFFTAAEENFAININKKSVRCRDNRATEQSDGQFNCFGRNFAACGGCKRPNRRIFYRFFKD